MTTRAQAARTAKMTPAEKAASSIRKGECDDGIGTILEAVQGRIIDGSVALRWRVKLDDLDVSEDELLLDEAETLERMLDVPWGEIEPLKTAGHARALIRVLYGRTLNDEDAKARVGELTVKQVLAAITRESEVDPPKA